MTHCMFVPSGPVSHQDGLNVRAGGLFNELARLYQDGKNQDRGTIQSIFWHGFSYPVRRADPSTSLSQRILLRRKIQATGVIQVHKSRKSFGVALGRANHYFHFIDALPESITDEQIEGLTSLGVFVPPGKSDRENDSTSYNLTPRLWRIASVDTPPSRCACQWTDLCGAGQGVSKGSLYVTFEPLAE